MGSHRWCGRNCVHRWSLHPLTRRWRRRRQRLGLLISGTRPNSRNLCAETHRSRQRGRSGALSGLFLFSSTDDSLRIIKSDLQDQENSEFVVYTNFRIKIYVHFTNCLYYSDRKIPFSITFNSHYEKQNSKILHPNSYKWRRAWLHLHTVRMG